MAGYFSPATFMTPNDWRARGPLGGFLAGMNQDIANQMVQREFADDDLQKQRDQFRFQQEQELAPFKKDQESYEAALARAKQQEITDGTFAQVRASDNAAKLSKNEASMSSDKEKIRENTAGIFKQMGEELRQMGGFDPMRDREWYDGYRQQLGSRGVNMPVIPSQADMVKLNKAVADATRWIETKEAGANADESFKTRNREAEARQRQQFALELEDARANNRYTQALDKAEMDNKTKLLMEEERSKRAREKQQAQDRYKEFFANSVRDIAAKGGVSTPQEAQTVEIFADMQAAAQLGGEESLMALRSPEAFQARKEERKQEILSTFPGYEDFKAKKDMGVSPKSSTKEVVPTINDGAAYDKLKPGDKYIDGRDGKTKVKS